MKLILASNEDPAAVNIASHIEELIRSGGDISENVRLVRLSGDLTRLSEIPENAEEVIVASRHAAEAGMPSLTVHVPGCPEERRFAIASPGTAWKALRALAAAREELGLEHVISLEATHHGPWNLEVPVTFVEIGSTPDRWSDRRAGEAVARAILSAVKDEARVRNAVGLGGPHYAPRHTEVAARTNVAPGHILPKYSRLDWATIETAVKRTAGGVELLLLDWKGLSAEQRATCMEAARKLGVMAVRTEDLLRKAKV